MIPVVRASDTTALEALRGGWDPAADVVDGVRAILVDVRARGDAALEEYTRRFDDPNADAGQTARRHSDARASPQAGTA